MPLFKSLRSKSSRKSSASVASDAESATDFGPHSPSSATYGSVRSAKGGPTDYTSASKRSLNKTASSAPSSPPSALPRYTSSSSIRGDHGARGGSDAQNASMMGTLAEVNSSSTGIDAKPKPSDLFAGKGVQWDAVHLAGPNTSPATVGRTSNNEELQNFLKMRRQWKPTFATEESEGAANFQPPKDLSQLTFSSGEKIQSQGLMSFKDLDESHQRKQKLLSSAPLGGSLWDEQPETSKAGSNRAAVATTKAAPSKGSAKAAPLPTRKESLKSSSRKLFGGEKAVPVRSTSAQIAKTGEGEANNSTSRAAAVPGVPGAGTEKVPSVISGGLPVTVDPGQLENNHAPPVVRESIESSTNQFETPNGSSSELTATEEGDKTLTNGKHDEESSKDETVIPHPPSQTATTAMAGEDRSVTPTPKTVEATT